MPNSVTIDDSQRRRKLDIARVATAAVAFTLAIAIVAAAACTSTSRQIKRADHDTLPTPTRGYFYPVADDTNGLGTASDTEYDSFDAFNDASFADDSDDVITTDEIAANPELAELFNKIDAGTATDADYQRIEAFLNNRFGGPQTLGQTVTGTITDIDGDRITITAFSDPADEQQSDEATPTPTPTPAQTVITITDETQFLVVSPLATSDIQPGDEISATAERNEEGRIRARTLSILEVDEDSLFAQTTGRSAGPPGFGQAPLGPSGGGRGNVSQTFTEDGDVVTIEIIEIRTETRSSAPVIGANVAGIPASGRVTKVVGQTVHVEARQGPLRITFDEQSITAKARQGAKQDLRTGMAAAATARDGTAITIVIGPTELINLDEVDRFQWMMP